MEDIVVTVLDTNYIPEYETKEEERRNNEEARVISENERIQNENARVNEESIRINNENSRVSSEAIRQSNETERISNEETRQQLYQNIKNKLDNGELKGEKGETGLNGLDGFSPIVETSKTGKVTTLTITDKNGTKTAEILDGDSSSDLSNYYTKEETENKLKEKVFYINNNTASNPFIFEEHELGMYMFPNNSVIYVKAFSNTPTVLSINSCVSAIEYINSVDTAVSYQTIVAKYRSRTEPSSSSAREDNSHINLTYNSSATGGLVPGASAKNIFTHLSTDTVQTISAKKTFTVLPETSITPTTNNQLVNKSYVDGVIPTVPTDVSSFTNDAGYLTSHQDISGKQDIIQYSTMPTASASNLGKIAQYIGTTTSSYTNGYFYQVVSDGAATPTYSWNNIDVQGSFGTTYTAGTNIEITNENVINNTIPYTSLEGTRQTGLGKSIRLYSDYNVAIGYEATAYENSTVLGYNATGKKHGVALGRYATTSQLGVAIGSSASNNSKNGSIAIGADAQNTKENQAMIGGTSTRINELAIYTSSGAKIMATQEYVDNKAIQTSIMETASSDNLGKIIQYTGTTDSNYTNGYFYKCVSDGQDPATYSWEEVEVQASSGGGNTDTKIYYIDDNSENNPFIFDENELGVYFFSDDDIAGFDNTKKTIYVKGTSSQTVATFLIDRTGYLKITKKYSQASNLEMFAVTNPSYSIDYGKLLVTIPTFIKMNDSIAGSSITQSSEWGVDASSLFTSLTGYDSTKTQVLKNVNGTLTWVDE